VAASRSDEAWADAWLRERGLSRRRPLVGLVPAGGVSWGIDAPFRRWSTRGFAAVGDALAARHGAAVLLLGEASDRAVCGEVAGLMSHPAIDLSGQTTLGQFVSLLGRLELVVCNDGGPLHLAVGRGVKTVSVFGPVDAAVYGPYPRDERHQVVKTEGLPCQPCYHRFRLPPCPYERACLTGVEPQQVIDACAQALGEAPRAAAAERS
jgi:ADP-heptose:LPS heptosyltransferase